MFSDRITNTTHTITDDHTDTTVAEDVENANDPTLPQPHHLVQPHPHTNRVIRKVTKVTRTNNRNKNSQHHLTTKTNHTYLTHNTIHTIPNIPITHLKNTTHF